MDERIILTIGRQFGSGGSEIGQKLATSLGIAYYDKELMALAARESGLCEELFERADEHTSGSVAYALMMGHSFTNLFTPINDVLSNDALFKLQSDAIRKVAVEGSCLLVGRCADYILRDDPACLSLFIHNTTENRIQRLVDSQQITKERAKELMVKTDKTRASYYNYYSNKTWGVASSYHLSIDASVLGIDETVAFIAHLVEKKKLQRPPHFG